MTSLPNSCGTPHIAHWVLGGIQESGSHGSSDAKGMLCKGCLCAPRDRRVCNPPPATLRGPGSRRIDAGSMPVLPPAHSSGAELGAREQLAPPGLQKGPEWGCHPPAPRVPGGGHSTAFGPKPRLQLISQRKRIFLPGANRNRHASGAGSPRQRCCAGAETRGARPGGERFASCRLAVYGGNTSVAWAVAAGDTGELRGHCLLPPSHQSPRGAPPSTRGHQVSSWPGRGCIWGRWCLLSYSGLSQSHPPVPKGAAAGHRDSLQGHHTAPCPAGLHGGKGYLSVGVMVPRRWAQPGCPAQEGLWGKRGRQCPVAPSREARARARAPPKTSASCGTAFPAPALGWGSPKQTQCLHGLYIATVCAQAHRVTPPARATHAHTPVHTDRRPRASQRRDTFLQTPSLCQAPLAPMHIP